MILSLKINRKFKCVATNATFYGYIHDEQWTWSSESVLLEYFQLDQNEGWIDMVSWSKTKNKMWLNIILSKLVLGVSWHVPCLPLISRWLCMRWIFMLVLILLVNSCWIFKLTGAQRTFGDFHPFFHVLVFVNFAGFVRVESTVDMVKESVEIWEDIGDESPQSRRDLRELEQVVLSSFELRKLSRPRRAQRACTQICNSDRQDRLLSCDEVGDDGGDLLRQHGGHPSCVLDSITISSWSRHGLPSAFLYYLHYCKQLQHQLASPSITIIIKSDPRITNLCKVFCSLPIFALVAKNTVRTGCWAIFCLHIWHMRLKLSKYFESKWDLWCWQIILSINTSWSPQRRTWVMAPSCKCCEISSTPD